MARFYHRRLPADVPQAYTRAAVSYVIKLGLFAAALLIVGVICMIIFGNIWARTGIGAATVVVVGGLLLFAWSVDRREKAKRAGLEDLPNV
jgi:Flp pilus assembly protein TadB